MTNKPITTNEELVMVYTKDRGWANAVTIDQRYNIRDMKEKKRQKAKERL